MRHRIICGLGLGNPEPVILNNSGKLNKRFADAALDMYFENHGGFDYDVTKLEVKVGIEPAYQYDRLLVISIHRNKKKSYIKQGKAWGPYGSDIVQNTKTYGEYKNNCKFTRFVDQWHSVLFGKK